MMDQGFWSHEVYRSYGFLLWFGELSEVETLAHVVFGTWYLDSLRSWTLEPLVSLLDNRTYRAYYGLLWRLTGGY